LTPANSTLQHPPPVPIEKRTHELSMAFRALSALTRALTARQLPAMGYSATSTVVAGHHQRWSSTAADEASGATKAEPTEKLWPAWKLRKLKKAHPKGAWMHQLDDAGILELSQRNKVNGQ
jgi:hypothetical protein